MQLAKGVLHTQDYKHKYNSTSLEKKDNSLMPYYYYCCSCCGSIVKVTAEVKAENLSGGGRGLLNFAKTLRMK